MAKRDLLFLCILLIPFLSLAQRNLSGSRQSSVYTYIFKITNEEALTLFRSDMEKTGEKYLHTLVDSFRTKEDNEPASLQPGNYVWVVARRNKLETSLHTAGDIQCKTINNDRDLVIALHTKQGKLISDAKVCIGNRQLPFDRATQTFRINKRKRAGLIKVYHEGVLYLFPLAEKEKRNHYFWKRLSQTFPIKYITQTIHRWSNGQHYWNYFSYQTPFEKKFRGFMTFNKPLFKPGDTVKLKAFILNKNGKPIDRPLLVRLTDDYFDIDTILATIHPYRPGGYEYQFVITDSMDLDLDKKYLITLEETRSRKYDLEEYDGNLEDDEYAKKRKVVMRGQFKHEEYELSTINFTARIDKKTNHRGELAAIYLKATDENDMAIMDGRVEIVIMPKDYGSKEFLDPYVFLPDTLWTHTQGLETIGETRINIPDSIFPAVSFGYQVKCTFLNSNNEYKTEDLEAYFDTHRQAIVINEQNDSLRVQVIEAGKSIAVSAVIYALDENDDTLAHQNVQLPVIIPVNPFVNRYEVQTPGLWNRYEMPESVKKITCTAARTKDSVSIQVLNPGHLLFWYTIFAGNKPIARGYTDSLLYLDRTTTAANYFISLQYIYANKLQKADYTIPYKDKLLTIQVAGEDFVYPGKTSTIDISVLDAMGRPVANTDITAYAFTKKFERARPPSVPYLGKVYRWRKRYGNFYLDEPTDLERSKTIKLNWQRWSKEMGLDSIEYFHFLHPQTIYVNREAAKDSLTQIAPFVVLNGDLQPVNQLYIDEMPVFFSQAQQLQRYSFWVAPGKHAIRVRTSTQILRLDSIWAEQGMKTFISINMDTAVNKKISLQKMPDTLTNYEKELWSKYMILMENNFREQFGYIYYPGYVYLLNPYVSGNHYNKYILTGPLSTQYNDLVVKDRYRQSFEAEGNYTYNITKGLIKQKQLPYGRYAFQSRLSHDQPEYNFSDFVLTEKEVDSLWREYLDNRNAREDLYKGYEAVKANGGKLQINVENDTAGKEVFVKNVILFRYDDPAYVRVYKGSDRDLGYLQPDTYRLFLLLKEDRYFILDSVKIQKNGLNYYSTGIIAPHLRDSMSIKIADVVNNREKWPYYKEVDMNNIAEAFNNKYLDMSMFNRVIYGQVKDSKTNEPLAAIVSVKGTRVVNYTDKQGFFRMHVPANASIIISSIGFETEEKRLTEEVNYDIRLRPAIAALSEVVVTVAYSTTAKELSSASYIVVSGDRELMGKLPGVTIRGILSRPDTAPPLIIIDGLPFSGRLEDLDKSQIMNMNVLKDAAATSIWGARAANGVIVITTKNGNGSIAITEETAPLPGNTMRKNFHDDAFWQPRLLTNAAGKASFTVTYPDDITNWRTFFVAMGPNRQTGFLEQSVRSFKLLSAGISLPQFAVAGDSMNVIGKTLNYGLDTIEVKRSFKVAEQPVQEQRFTLSNSHIDTFMTNIPTRDSIKFSYSVEKPGGYFDGEERVIPVFKKGVLETTGFFAALNKDTSFSVPLIQSTGEIKLYAESSVLPVLLDEIEKLRDYEYLCNEQLASKLKALLLKKKVYSYLQKDFREEKNINELISKLNQAKTSGGLWGWWNNNDPVSWITLHVVEALLLAEKEGYKVNLNKQMVIDYLVHNFQSNKAADKVYYIRLFQLLNAKVDYTSYIFEAEKQKSKKNLYDTLRLLEVKQISGLTVKLDSLIGRQSHTIFGNIYWGEEEYRFFDNSIQNTILMYGLLKRTGGYDNLLQKIQNYFLEKRSTGKWRNTYESSLILETILPDLLKRTSTSGPTSIAINGGSRITTFPYEATLQPGQSITISKQGAMPVYFTAYEQHWNETPAKSGTDFVVNSTFENNQATVSSLKAGVPVVLKVNVKVNADAGYVMVEVPIPAGCSYKDKQQSYSNNEAHREYFKSKVSIFCSSLKKGEYLFTVSLLPRYTGSYHLNPAKAEMMYFPVFYGRTEMKKVVIF